MYSVCVFWERILLINSPRKFVSNSCTGLFIFICNLYVRNTCNFFNKLNEISFVRIQEKKLALNLLFSWPKTISFWNWILFGLVINIPVSSANRIGIALCSMVLGKSLIYTRISSGPKTEPCSTPYFTLVHFETLLGLRFMLMIWTLWYLFCR